MGKKPLKVHARAFQDGARLGEAGLPWNLPPISLPQNLTISPAQSIRCFSEAVAFTVENKSDEDFTTFVMKKGFRS